MMEVKRNSSSISVINKSENTLTVTVEYIHYVEELAPGEVFRIEIYSTAEIELNSILSLEYNSDKSLTFLLNNHIEYYGKYEVRFFIADKCVYQQIL